jgi:hypothetical protein
MLRDPSCVRAVLEFNPDLSVRDIFGQTALMQALMLEDEECVTSILERHPDQSIQDPVNLFIFPH